MTLCVLRRDSLSRYRLSHHQASPGGVWGRAFALEFLPGARGSCETALHSPRRVPGSCRKSHFWRTIHSFSVVQIPASGATQSPGRADCTGIVVGCKHAALPRTMSTSLSKWMEEVARQSESESTTGATDRIEQTARTDAATRTPQASFLLTSTTSTALYD